MLTSSGATPVSRTRPCTCRTARSRGRLDGNQSTNADNKAYTVFVDNEEQGGEDVDILDITNPRAPVFINEFSLNAPAGGSSGFGDNVLLHDMVVEKIGVRRHDAGVLLGRRLREARRQRSRGSGQTIGDSDSVTDPL